MKRLFRFFLFTTAFVSVETASAQVREFTIGADANSIVREVNGDTLLIYTEVSPTESYFVYYINGDATARAFRLPVLPSLKVNDVRVVDDEYAYFCGSVNLGGVSEGLVGRFRIQDVFTGTGSVEYGHFDGFPDNDIKIESLQRLDMYNARGFDCMAMVGVGLCDGIAVYPVVSAYQNGGLWEFNTTVQKQYFGFTDIACLDNMVVATGLLFEDSSCIVKSFWIDTNLPANECYPGYIHRFTYGNVKGRPLIAQYKNDTAVVAYFDVPSLVNTVLQRQPFDVSTGKPLPNSLARVAPHSSLPFSSGWNLLELAAVDDSVFLLQHASYPPILYIPPILEYWRLRAQFALPVMEAWTPQYGTQHSMDVSHAGMLTSKSTANNFLLHGPAWPSADNGCHNFQMVNVDNINVNVKEIEVGIDKDHTDSSVIPLSPTVFSINAEVICNSYK